MRLRARLSAARNRIDALIDKLPLPAIDDAAAAPHSPES
jgi:hypothetical protein